MKKKMGKTQFIGVPLTLALAVAVGYLYGTFPAFLVAWIGLTYFLVTARGSDHTAGGGAHFDDYDGGHDGGHSGDHGGDHGSDGGGSG
jgi:predicted ABC-type sugar transport system permease subunit